MNLHRRSSTTTLVSSNNEDIENMITILDVTPVRNDNDADRTLQTPHKDVVVNKTHREEN